uniref:RRM domain-containing protein n=3 Tax=Nothobranchius TaxID=28779 RepID=A0A1A8QLZ9_9TELE
MEPSSSAAETCNPKKRKNEASTEHNSMKRSKTEEGCDEELRNRPSGSPRLSVQLDRLQQPVSLLELTELLHFAALGTAGGLKQPSWCHLHHQKKVKGVNVVILEGLSQSHFYKNYLTMEHLRTNYTTRVTFTPSPISVASGIFSSDVPKLDRPPVPKSDDKLHKAVKHHPVIKKYGTQKRGVTAYVLTQEEMIKNHFPVRGIRGFEDFSCTKNNVRVTDDSPLYGLDCEMCLTEKGHELTRVSLVDSDGNCVLDELVKPQSRVLNYLTKFSGITAAMLQPITTTLRVVQAKLRMLLPGDAVLVGHSLNNDLIALKLIHQHVIDTSLLYKKELGQKFKLKVLAEMVLKRQIQTDENNGHNPTEDAAAALELAQYFIKTGPHQVVELHLEELWGYKPKEESSECSPAPSHRFTDILRTIGRSVTYLGKRADVALDLSNQQWYSTDKEVLSSFRRQTKNLFLSIVQFSSFSDHLRRHSAHQEQLYQSVCSDLRDMCVVFAGPFPPDFSDREVRRLFRCCGRVRNIRMLNTSVRIHAEVAFEMLEGALLALKVLDGLRVLGQPIKVQRPVKESMLDLDLYLDTLLVDSLNSKHLYAVKPSQQMAQNVNISQKVNQYVVESKGLSATSRKLTNGLPPAKKKCKRSHLTTLKLSEETVREAFDHFGTVESIVLPSKCSKHVCIEFESSEGKLAALSSSEDLLSDRFLIHPSVTPPHLPSWVAMTTAETKSNEETNEGRESAHMDSSSQGQAGSRVMKKLDFRLRKVFRSLPEGSLSVVVLPGQTSENGHYPGLCLFQVKVSRENVK